eukprot:CAMPEP_0116065826 /NCGR_PEP_ID=MMETSP0322-20121206/10018_1 /TAXON_ID=163516 /ORGANISM="Leptocylindrus danicus var. apora, Strain B651" /LENGTH=53 /DNA_ID=CAMNT_0003552263 /DNA_START=114 /DNA_END=272 /DNA_ORIENTATION=+
MASSAESRIAKELSDVCKEDKIAGIEVKKVNETDNRKLTGKIKGPEGSVYEGG